MRVIRAVCLRACDGLCKVPLGLQVGFFMKEDLEAGKQLTHPILVPSDVIISRKRREDKWDQAVVSPFDVVSGGERVQHRLVLR